MKKSVTKHLNKWGGVQKTSLILFFLSAVIFASCSNMLASQGESSSARGCETGSVVFNGSICVTGALPAALSHAELDSASQSSASRSALPSFTIGADYYYYVTATKTDGSSALNINSLSTPNPFTTTNGVTFALELPTGNWNIECGIKKAEASDDDLPVMSDTYLAPLTSANPVVNHTFYPKPSQEGSGNVALNISYDSGTVNSVTAKCGNESWTVSTSGTPATIEMDAIASGTYDLSIYFYKNDGNGNSILVYSTVQTINVFDNMLTNTWVSDGSGLISDSGVFNLTDTLINQFTRTTFYVGSTSVGAASNDTGNGSPYAPFETVNKAVEVIAATGESSKDYRIYVSGTVTGAQEISEGVNGKANSITIQGYNGLDTNGEPKDALNGNNEGSSLTIDTNVPVTIKNLKITGGSGTPVSGRQRGGGIYVKSGSVTLSEGTFITGNNADHGGGIYVESAATALIAGGEISANTANIYGGGIYNRGNVFVYGNSNFKNNSCTVSMQYGGAVYNSGNLYLGYSSASNKSEWKGEISGNSAVSAGAIWSAAEAKVCFDSGTIKGNSADWNGQNQSLLIMGKGVFEMGGSAYIASTDPVYLCAFGSDDIISPVTITSSLTAHSASDKITLTLSEWKRGTTVVQAGTNVPDLTPYKDYFAFTQDGWKCKVSSDNQYLVLDAPIYVAESGKDETGDGSKSKPYATIAKAVEAIAALNTSANYTINIDGTVTGAQTIGENLNGKASSLTIVGETGNTKDILNGNNEETTLNIQTSVPVTIKNLKITAGRTSTSGGGIYNNFNGNLTLSSGCLVTGNYAGNSGGGICNAGTLTISDAEISNNEATSYGGGVYNSRTFNMTSGTISGNNTTSKGGGVNNSGTFNMSGGSISGNTASNEGNGIYMNGTLEISGSAKIDSSNDVYLIENKYITVTGELGGNGIMAAITAESWSRGKEVIKAGTGVTLTVSYLSRFQTTNEDWDLVLSSSTSITIDTPIYVAGSGYKVCKTSGNDSSGDGSKSKPYATITKAYEQMNDIDRDYIINIDGTLSGSHTLPDTLKSDGSGTNNAKSLTLLGVSGINANHEPIATLDGGFSNSNTGRVLTIETDVPVKIKALTIKNGYLNEDSDWDGGGIYISSSSTVTLGDEGSVNGDYTNTVLLTNNSGVYGNAISSEGVLTLCNCTFKNNNVADHSSTFTQGDDSPAISFDTNDLILAGGNIHFSSNTPGDIYIGAKTFNGSTGFSTPCKIQINVALPDDFSASLCAFGTAWAYSRLSSKQILNGLSSEYSKFSLYGITDTAHTYYIDSSGTIIQAE
ncbi:MAG: hypothetical protein IJ530_15430 [Treponema sp.]|uniref:beta strand repeat-containing protein n=1 Tax=Treponema sp. TaxID=166 RepID=UPI0025F89530|nr:hypothetical protein [Treponema sp.]MBQ8681122.1 hypothetical protein [Treponema sp.]